MTVTWPLLWWAAQYFMSFLTSLKAGSHYIAICWSYLLSDHLSTVCAVNWWYHWSNTDTFVKLADVKLSQYFGKHPWQPVQCAPLWRWQIASSIFYFVTVTVGLVFHCFATRIVKWELYDTSDVNSVTTSNNGNTMSQTIGQCKPEWV